ncbi:Basement membranespecific heparan sulfate proteoglycan core proteinlike, partial [Caligus rogercresseyi]
ESDCAPRGPIESPQNPSVTTVNSFNFTQYFMCKDGIYISKSYVCDGIRHCSSGEDERNCEGGKSLVVKSLTVRNFDEMVFLRSETPFIAVYFYAPWCKACNRFRPIFKRVSKEFHGRNLTFYDVNLEQEPLLGDRFMIDTFPRVLFWNLLLQGTPMEFYKNYGLTKNGFIYWLDNVLKIKKRNDCGLLEFPCESSRECIPKGLVCDSFTQCRDGSDERLCPGNRGNKTMLLPASQINGGVNILPTGRPMTTTIRPTTPRRA